jgi:hypothetical protein
VVYNLIAVGLILMVFVIFVPRGLVGAAASRPRRRRSAARAGGERALGSTGN